MEGHIQQLVIWKQATCETFISIRITHNNTFQEYQQNWGFNIFLIRQNLRRKTVFHAIFKKKDCCFIVEKFQIINISEAVKLYQYFQSLFWNLEKKLENRLKIRKIKKSEFQKL